MEESRKNDQFLDLLSQHEAQIFGFLFALVCHRQDAEDLMQQATVTMWRKFDEFELGTNFGAWACQIAKNCALNHLQSQQRKKLFSSTMIELLADTQAEQDAEARQARRHALSSCLEKLNDADRQLVSQCYAVDASIKAVAQSINRPAAGVYNSLGRIRRMLYQCIEATLSRQERQQ